MILAYGLSLAVTAVLFFTLGRSWGWHIRDEIAWRETAEVWRAARGRYLGRGASDEIHS